MRFKQGFFIKEVIKEIAFCELEAIKELLFVTELFLDFDFAAFAAFAAFPFAFAFAFA